MSRRTAHQKLLFTVALLSLLPLAAPNVSMAEDDPPPPLIYYPNGFAGVSGVQTNGTASFKDNVLKLTDGGRFEAGSAFFTHRVPTYYFTTTFDFQLSDASADGFAFVMQDTGPNALGSAGGGLGYGNLPGGAGARIVDSSAVAFDLHSNQGEGGNSVRVERNGVTNGADSFTYDLTPYGLDLHSGHRFHVELTSTTALDGGRITVTDTVTNASAVILTFFFNLSNRASGYVGFTGATGAASASQAILNWAYYPDPGANCHCDDNYADLSFPDGFAGATGLQFNGGAKIAGSTLQLTHGTPFEATSVFATKKIEVDYGLGYGGFETDFDFTMGDGSGDGFAFVVQGESPFALGSSGGGLGYGPARPGISGYKIGRSQAVKFDLHNNAGEGSNSTGVYNKGASPTTPSLDLSPSGINLHNGHTFHAHLVFEYFDTNQNDSYVTITLTDLNVYKVFQKKIAVSDSELGIDRGLNEFVFLGFTSSTGANLSSINILNWRLRAVAIAN